MAEPAVCPCYRYVRDSMAAMQVLLFPILDVCSAAILVSSGFTLADT